MKIGMIYFMIYIKILHISIEQRTNVRGFKIICQYKYDELLKILILLSKCKRYGKQNHLFSLACYYNDNALVNYLIKYALNNNIIMEPK